jgi:hypothetical protein
MVTPLEGFWENRTFYKNEGRESKYNRSACPDKSTFFQGFRFVISCRKERITRNWALGTAVIITAFFSL